MKMKKLAVMALATALSVGSVMTASAAWLQEGSNWKYQNDNGTFQTGTWFQDVDGKWYHFDNNGNMQKGWFLDADGKWYFMAYHGAMQTGLIRVDNAVYFMNPSGDLFIGEKEISGVKYNFGLYGTTNGTPSVGQSATFGGNGNQSKPGGGGGSSSSTGDNDKEVVYTPEVEDAVKEVTNVADDIKKDNTAVEDIKVVKGENNKVQVTVAAAKDLDLDDPEKAAELEEAVQSSFDAVLASTDDGQAVVNYKGKPIPVDTDTDISVYINQDNLDKNMGNSVDVTVKVGGETVTYTIKLSK